MHKYIATFLALTLLAITLAIPHPALDTPQRKHADLSPSARDTFQDCRTDDDCEDNRECVTANEDGDLVSCKSNSARCICSIEGLGPCPSENTCDEDEVCLQAINVADICIDPETGDVDVNVCVDANALSHLERHELVYEQHARAKVLCDKDGSCATPGHMVVWEGKAMMMRSYCQVVGCNERVMEVNSPIYRKATRIPSKTEGLEYTAFAARYETRTEEVAMSLAVRVGL